MANYVVTTGLDEAFDGGTLADETSDGFGLSLREAIGLANLTGTADSISFTIGFAPGVSDLTLVSGELSITNDLTIDGTGVWGANDINFELSGNDATRIFNISGVGTDVVLTRLDLVEGYTSGNGGAIHAGVGTSLGISDTFIGASSALLSGGGIFADQAVLTLTNSLVTDVGATVSGGGIQANESTVTLTQTTIHNNITDGAGGGINTSGGTLTLYNSTVTNNRADVDGASTTSGGGISESGTTLTLYNTIVADNVSGTTRTPDDLSGTVTATSSFFGTSETLDPGSSGNINGGGDPGLGQLGEHGGFVQTQNIEHHSPLVDAGDGVSLPGGLTLDANGNSRISGTEVDIGATELNEVTVTTLLDVVADDGLISLREAVAEGGLVTFDPTLAGGTIVLSGTELLLEQDIAIDGDVNGDNIADITISGADASSIFYTADAVGTPELGVDVDLFSLTLTNAFGTAIFGDTNSTLNIYDTTIRDSYTPFGGGAISTIGRELTLVNSLLTNNTAVNVGGAIHANNNAEVLLINTTVTNNSSGYWGGGLFVGGALNLTVLNSTITNNRAEFDGPQTDRGGGIWAYSSTIANSVVADNTSGSSPGSSDIRGTVTYAYNSFIGVPLTYLVGSGNIIGGGDPLLGALLDNGGTVLSLSPLDGSPLIGAGSNAAIPLDLFDVDGDRDTAETLPLDGRGGLRLVGATVDIGAVEQIVDETIRGTDGDNTILAGAGNDTVEGGAGNDHLSGGDDTDVAVYSGNHADYSIDAIFGGFTVADNVTADGDEGFDRLFGIETLRFADGDFDPASLAPANSLPAPHDFNGDGKSDLVWQHDNGQAAIWQMNGTTVIGGGLAGSNPGPAWDYRDTGDFNNDGRADLVFQNDNGQAAIWQMNGTTVIGGGLAGNNPGPTWQIGGTGDFNSDGNSDLVWQNDNGQAAIWFMNGNSVIGGGLAGSNPGPTWQIEGTGDFNSDGNSDLLWQNDNGQAAIWLMDGTSIIGGGLAGNNPGPTWQIGGTGDFNGDGNSDIVWQNDNGQAAIWFMNGNTVIGGGLAGNNPGSTWHIRETGDYNDDGKFDFVWQNENGQSAIWFMDGTTVIGGGLAGSNPGPDWMLFA